MAKTPEKQLQWAKNYMGKMDEIKIRVPKGKKDKIKAHAESKGESVNGYINRLIDEDMENGGKSL